MFQRLRQCALSRLNERDQDGFTLIELLVVLLIMGILLAIAIPTYLSVTGSANSTAAQSNLQTVLTASKAYYVSNNQTYSAVTPSLLTGTSLTIVTGTGAGNTSTDPSIVSIDGSQNSGSDIVLAAEATNGKCYVIIDAEAALTAAVGSLAANSAAGTWYGQYTPSSSSACDATVAESASAGPSSYSSTASSGWTGTPA